MSGTQVQITQLPSAGPITGTELVPIVQNGQTLHTTTGAIAASPSQTQTFLTVNQEPTLPNSRALSAGSGVTLTDGGAQAALQIGLDGAAASLNSAGTGIVAKTSSTAVAARSIASGTSGLSVANGDGISGNPTISLTGQVLSLANASGAGLVALPNNGTVTPVEIVGVSGQTVVTNGTGATGNPTVGLADNPILPGNKSVTIPVGNTSNRPLLPLNGMIRYNTDILLYEGYANGSWASFASGNGVTSIDTGTGLTGGPITTTGTISIANTGVAAGTYGSSTLIPQFVVNAQGQITSVTEFSVIGGVASVTGTANEITASPTTGDVVLSLPSALTFTGKTITGGTYTSASISGSTNTLSNIGNSSLTNSSITINGSTISLGDSATITAVAPNALTIGTGLNGTSYNGSAPVTIELANTAVTPSTYGSSNYVPVIAVDQQGRITSASQTEITPSGIGAISAVNGTTDQITSSQVGTVVTLAIANAPLLVGPVKVKGTGTTTITPFAQSMGVFEADDNNYQEVYARNVNNGSDASADFIAYNDASDLNSYFIDMGMNSSNFTSVTYPIFTPNSGYLFTGGGLSGQQSDLFIGTSNPASDIIFFTGDVQTANQRAMFSGTTGNLLINTATDDGTSVLQVAGNLAGQSATFTAAVTSTSTSITSPANNEFVTKSYVDQATSTGIHIHTPVTAETSAALSAVYTQGGTTFNITDITGTNTVVTSTAHGLSVNDEIWLTTTAGNGLSINTAYFVYATPTTTSLQLSISYGGPLLTGLTNASGLSYATIANSGVGAYLEASANAVLPIAGVIVGDRVLVYQQLTGYWNGIYTVTSLGSVGSKWKLTRATDANQYQPDNTAGMGAGDYFFVQSNSESYVLTDPVGPIIIGYDSITYTLFSSVPVYTGTSPINVTGTVISLGTVPATNGGTGTATVATGDLLYGSATDTWSKLPLGSAYKALTINASGTQVEWNAIALNQASAVSGQLNVSNGGTGASTLTGYVKGNGTSAMTASSTIPNTDITGLGTMSTQDASNVAITGGAIDGTTVGATTATTVRGTTITATTQFDGAGTGLTGTASGLSIGGNAATATSATSATTATNLAGGIASQIPYQTGAGATSFIANGTAGQVLTSAGTSAPTWSGINGGTF